MAESPSTYFPDYSVMWDLRYSTDHGTQIIRAFNGREQRRARFQTRGYRQFTATSKFLDTSERSAVYEFLQSRRGAFEAFWFWAPDSRTYSDLPVGSVAASSTFEIPMKSTTLTTVKVGGVSKAFTVTAGAGAGGEDEITFTAGPQTGAVTVSGTGRERLTVRADAVIPESFQPGVVGYAMITLQLQEVA